MTGLEQFMWRSNHKWSELVATGESVIARWNTVTPFVTRTDLREHPWIVRHSSVAQPFLVLNEDSLRGSVPRIGNPLPFLLLLGIAIARPGSIELSFANGQKIDPTKFDPADLTGLLPQATHAAHRKLAELVAASPAAQSASAPQAVKS